MKTSIVYSLLLVFFVQMGWSQNQTTVIANSNEISDNLDLRAVASLFGEARSIEDFEYRLNDPALRISNLDLNYDRQVDYIRVVESADRGTHLVVLQAVLERDVYQDIATIEVERQGSNYVTQVVGNPYFYGANYIYQPVYVTRPALFSVVFQLGYRPYVSPWYYGYYPTYFSYWNPYPIYRYRKHVHKHINVHNHYTIVNVRHSSRAPQLYGSVRHNAYEVRHPQQAFAVRHQNVGNRAQLAQGRPTTGRNAVQSTRTTAPQGRTTAEQVNRSATATRSATVEAPSRTTRNATATRNESAVQPRSTVERPSRGTANNLQRSSQNQSVGAIESRSNGAVRSQSATTRNQAADPARSSMESSSRTGASSRQPAASVRQSSSEQRNAPTRSTSRSNGNGASRGEATSSGRGNR